MAGVYNKKSNVMRKYNFLHRWFNFHERSPLLYKSEHVETIVFTNYIKLIVKFELIRRRDSIREFLN